MAVNDLATAMIVVKSILLCLLCSSATSNDVEYQIASIKEALSSEANLIVNFASHAHGRFRRQSPAEDTTANGNVPINADTATNAGTGGQALPDAATQPVNFTTPVTAAPPSTNKPTTAPPSVTTTLPPDIIHDFHNYYTSDVIRNKVDQYWIELADAPRHETLSTSHRVAAVIKLKFPFYFYGHEVSNVTVATGGFIYMSPFLHQWLTATQYIAPLMANFDPSMSDDSEIYYQSDDDKFIVEWKNVMLKDQNDTGKFHFQAVLSKDNSIRFVYKSVPVAVDSISTDEHPVKVGLSDAYYNDTYVPEYSIKRRTIYEYHKVAVTMSYVVTGNVIVLNALPTCNRLTACDSCVQHINVNFDCSWCNTIGRCSDGLDWYRQHWDKQGCKRQNVTDMEECSATTTTHEPLASPTSSTPSPQITTLKSSLSTKAQSSPPTTGNVPTTTKSSTPGQTTLDRSEADRKNCGQTNDTDVCSSLPQPQSPITDSLEPSAQSICNNTKDQEACATLPPPPKPITDPLSPVAVKDDNKCPNGKCDSGGSKFPVAVVVVIALIVILLGGVGAWVFYAYKHPTSKSGMWLMEHRPSQIKAKIKFWKSNTDAGTKYKVESEA